MAISAFWETRRGVSKNSSCSVPLFRYSTIDQRGAIIMPRPANAWLGFLCGLPQHYGIQPNSPDFRYNTRTFTCAWLPAFLYWNMQYHAEHHMYPAVPFFNLPKLREKLAHDLPPAPHGLRATWKVWCW